MNHGMAKLNCERPRPEQDLAVPVALTVLSAQSLLYYEFLVLQ